MPRRSARSWPPAQAAARPRSSQPISVRPARPGYHLMNHDSRVASVIFEAPFSRMLLILALAFPGPGSIQCTEGLVPGSEPGCSREGLPSTQAMRTVRRWRQTAPKKQSSRPLSPMPFPPQHGHPVREGRRIALSTREAELLYLAPFHRQATPQKDEYSRHLPGGEDQFEGLPD